MLNTFMNLDRRVIYVVLLVVLFIPLYKPIGLPLPITRESKATYEFIDKLPADSVVLMINSTGPSVEAELYPQTLTMARHLMSKNIKIVICSLAVEAPRYNTKLFERWAAEYKYESGRDYVILPYKAGGETAMAAIGRDIVSLYTTDDNNKPLAGMPLWSRIKSVKDFACVIDISGGESQRWMLGHIQAPHKVPSIAAITAVILAVTQPYFSSGQLVGMLSGLNGAAEYELQSKTPGPAAAGMDAQSLGHMWIVVLVLIGNIAYIASRSQTKKK